MTPEARERRRIAQRARVAANPEKSRAYAAKRRASPCRPRTGEYSIQRHSDDYFTVHAPSYLDGYGRMVGWQDNLADAIASRGRLAREHRGEQLFRAEGGR